MTITYSQILGQLHQQRPLSNVVEIRVAHHQRVHLIEHPLDGIRVRRDRPLGELLHGHRVQFIVVFRIAPHVDLLHGNAVDDAAQLVEATVQRKAIHDMFVDRIDGEVGSVNCLKVEEEQRRLTMSQTHSE